MSRMGADPQTRAEIRAERAKRADGGEPLHTTTRTVHWSGDSLVVGVTDYGVKTHDVEQGQEPAIEVHPDGIWIDFGGDGDE